MATIAKFPIEPVRTISGGPPRMVTLPLGATQTFKRGEVVQLSAGYVIVCGSNNPSAILGVAAEDATSGTAGAVNIKVYAADPSTIFCGNLSDSLTTSLLIVGLSYGIKDEGSTWGVDTASVGTNARVVIQNLDPRDTVGDTNGRVEFTFKATYFQLGSTS